MDETKNFYHFKLILLGDIAVGKSSILSRYTDDKYSVEYHCNVGVEFKVKSLFLDEKTGADLQIWDTCGEERFRSITRQYYRDSSGILLIYDITNRASFLKLETWMQDILSYGPKETTIYLVGNKIDIENERETSFQEASDFAQKYQINYIEVSAKMGIKVTQLFENITKTMVRKDIEKERNRRVSNGSKYNSQDDSRDMKKTILSSETRSPRRKSCC
jgi:small GTP-binding protein